MTSIGSTPTLGAMMTIVVYLLALVINRRLPSPFTHPVLLSVAFIILCLKLLGITYADYDTGGSLFTFFLGPVVVALSVPLYRQHSILMAQFLPTLGSVAIGGSVSIVSSVLIARALHGSESTLLSIAPKSVTLPIAIGISAKTGGIPSLTAAVVIATGVLGGAFGLGWLSLLRVRSPYARGLAMGTASHGIGTARCFEDSELVGVASSLAMALNGLFTVAFLPLILASLLR